MYLSFWDVFNTSSPLSSKRNFYGSITSLFPLSPFYNPTKWIFFFTFKWSLVFVIFLKNISQSEVNQKKIMNKAPYFIIILQFNVNFFWRWEYLKLTQWCTTYRWWGLPLSTSWVAPISAHWFLSFWHRRTARMNQAAFCVEPLSILRAAPAVSDAGKTQLRICAGSRLLHCGKHRNFSGRPVLEARDRSVDQNPKPSRLSQEAQWRVILLVCYHIERDYAIGSTLESRLSGSLCEGSFLLQSLAHFRTPGGLVLPKIARTRMWTCSPCRVL